MRWWDSTDVDNGTFNSDLTGWTQRVTPSTYEWVTAGGGLTGAAHIIGDGLGDGIGQAIFITKNSQYRIQADLNIPYNSGIVQVKSNLLNYTYNITDTGDVSIDTIVTANSLLSGSSSLIVRRWISVDSVEFYVDNISVTNIIDSVQGTSKVFQNYDLVSGGTYWYDFVTIPDGGNDSYSNGIDSFFVAIGDTIPTFAFTDVTGVALGSYNTTSTTFSETNDSFYVYAAGDSFKIGALGTLDVGIIKVAYYDTLFVSLVASANCSTAVTSIVTAGGVSDTWSVTTTTDDTPDAFAFTDVTNAELSTAYEDTVVIAGMGCDADISISPQLVTTIFKIHYNGIWRDANNPTTVSNGDTVYIRVTSSENYSTVVSGTLAVEGVSDIYSVTTKAEPEPYYYIVNKSGNKALLFKTGTYAIKLKD